MKVRVVMTDSNYIHFPFMDNKPSHELWDHCLKVEKDINKLFPEPMKLLFEEAIYRRFFILSKKRYMALKIDRDGVQKEGIEKRGVLLQRRDNAEVIRNMYRNVIMMIFNHKTKEEVENYVLDELNNLCCYKYPMKDFVM
jgi:DNA polymerase elongation subunit (family B)